VLEISDNFIDGKINIFLNRISRLLQNPRFHLGLFTFNPYGVDILKE